MLEYVHEDFPECESHKEVECRSVLTVSSLKAAIKQGASLHELKALRRQFARDRHPDLVPVNERASATRDMTLVNAMIDRAILDAER